MATQSQCKRALELHEDSLGTYINVMGLGIVPRDPSLEGKQELVLGVYLKKKVHKNKLASEDIIPSEVEIPGRGGTKKIPIRLIEQGEVKLE